MGWGERERKIMTKTSKLMRQHSNVELNDVFSKAKNTVNLPFIYICSSKLDISGRVFKYYQIYLERSYYVLSPKNQKNCTRNTKRKI